MKREILFRGKRIDNGEWESGSLVRVRMGCSDERVYIADKMTGYLTPVIPETVGQYTGLKDKNGKKIYIGDILQYNDNKYIIRESRLGWLMYRRGKHATTMWIHKYEIIGNIHDKEE